MSFKVKNNYRVVIIAMDWLRPKDPPVSLGHASLLAKLYQNQFIKENVEIFNLEYNVNNHIFKTKSFDDFCLDIAHKSLSYKPNLISFGAYIWNEIFIQKIVKLLRSEFRYEKAILLGGPQITYAPKFSLEQYYPQVDFFIRGYGEDSFCNTIENLASQYHNNLETIKGLHLANKTDLGLQSKSDFISLPSPFLTNLISLKRNFIRWESKRGCPFKCTFCQHRDINAKSQHICFNRIEAEINKICKSKVNDIAVLDPTFNSGNEYLNVLESFIKNKFKGKMALQIKLEMINDNFIDKLCKMKDNGAHVILECGIQTIINEEMKIIKRMNNLKRINLVADKLHKNSVEFEISLIYGLPKQTVDSFKLSVDYCKTKLKPKRIYAWPLMILRGTELELDKQVHGLNEEIISMNECNIDIDNTRLFHGIPHVTSSNSFSKKDWLEMVNISKNID